MSFVFLDALRNDWKTQEGWYQCTLLFCKGFTRGGTLPMRNSPRNSDLLQEKSLHFARQSVAYSTTYLFSPILPASMPPTLP